MNGVRRFIYSVVFGAFAAGVPVIFNSCENPYIIHNLSRPVVLKGLEFHTNTDGSGDVYSLKPVFDSSIKNYTVQVHELATEVLPSGFAEDGAFVVFGTALFVGPGNAPVQDSRGNTFSAYENGRYRYPSEVYGLHLTFTIVKEYRAPETYAVLVTRRSDPGRIAALSIRAVEWTGAGTPDPNPSDPGWDHGDTSNYMENFHAAGQNYEVQLPYYADKILIEPDAPSDVIVGYTLYEKDPQYYPEHVAAAGGAVGKTVSHSAAAVPLYIDFTGSSPAVYDSPQLRVRPPEVDVYTGLKTSYLWISTAVEDPDTHEQRYHFDYKIKLVWKKSKAYLSAIDVRDDKVPGTKRLQGNFITEAQNYGALVHQEAGNITVKAVPRKSSYTVQFEEWTMIGGAIQHSGPLPHPADLPLSSPPSYTYTRPFSAQAAAVRIIVRNPGFPEDDYTYWVEVGREADPATLVNLRIEGQVSGGPWKTLFWSDGGSLSAIPDPLLTFKEIPHAASPAPPYFDVSPGADDPTNYTLEVDGTVTRLRVTGYREPGGSAPRYRLGDGQNEVLENGVEFAFTGGTGLTVTALRSGFRDRPYGFTIVRAGALGIDLYTDMDDPEAPGSPNPLLNSYERGIFQAFISTNMGKAVNTSLPGNTVVIRVTPKLGWEYDSHTVTLPSGAPLAQTTPGKSGDVWSWQFTMPNEKVTIVLTYKLNTDKVPRVAYAAPRPGSNLDLRRASRTGGYGDGDGRTATSWAYASSNLQAIINSYKDGGFDEIWLLEGGYTIDSWAEELTGNVWSLSSGTNINDVSAYTDTGSPVRSDTKNMAFVLKQGLRIYGGFSGTEGSSLGGAAAQKQGRERPSRSSDPARTYLSGLLYGTSTSVRHVVIAAGIAPRDGDTPNLSNRDELDTEYDVTIGSDANGIFGGSGVTLLDTLSIQDGLRTKDDRLIKYKGNDNANFILHTRGAGLYAVNASPVLNNVLLTRNTSVAGGGMYNTANGGKPGGPVMNKVKFINNDATGYAGHEGDGAGFANYGASALCLPVFIDCEFRNNSITGGRGAGIYAEGGGGVLVKGCTFSYNDTNTGGGLSNYGNTWVFDSEFSYNRAGLSGGGVENGGDLKLVNVTVKNNTGGGINNGGALAAANLTALDGISSGGYLGMTDSTIQGSGISLGGASVIANTVIAGSGGTGLSFGVTSNSKDPASPVLAGCILANVTVTGWGTGIRASYSSEYTHNHGAANLVMNSVRVTNNGTGVDVSGNTAALEQGNARSGVYVTMNNVTIAGNTAGLTTASAGPGGVKNVAVPGTSSSWYDAVDVRVRNSVILGNTIDVKTGKRPFIGTFASARNIGSGSVTLGFSPDKAAMLAAGDTFRITDEGSPDSAWTGETAKGKLRTPVYIVTGKGAPGADGLVPVTFTASAAQYVNAGDYIVKDSFFKASLGAIGAAGILSGGGSGSLVPDPLVFDLLKAPGTLFRITNDPSAGAPGPLTCRVTAADSGTHTITYAVTGSGSQSYAASDHIMINSERAAAGPIDSRLRLSSEDSNTWTLSASQAALFAAAAALPGGADFRLVDTDGRLTPSRNNVASVSGVSGNVVTFSADAPDRFTGDYGIMVDGGRAGAANAGALVAGTNTWTLPNERAELLWDSSSNTGRTFRIARPNGTMLSSINTVTSVTQINASTSEVEFTSTSAGSCAPLFRIMILNGTAGAVNTLGSFGASALYLTPERASVLSGKTFRFAVLGPDGSFRWSTEYAL
ncbi:MAG: right-handed parallel beta-helix repeat-containing protein [Treponema sp.]|nr:right-handed parallel beta-helix repeat-containing protein [Treponema sp.]